MDDCLGIMAENDIRHVPVMDRQNRKVVGVISIRDVVREAVADRGSAAEGLRKYLGSGDYI